jgi:hypothetical protein
MDTSKYIYTESKKYFSKGNKYWIYHVDLLKKISNINIFTFVTISLEQISFNILSKSNPNNLLFRHVYPLNSYSENSIKTFVLLVKQIVFELKFDKLSGVFVSKNSKSPKPLFFEEFGLDYIDKNNCIECLEQTISKLKCNHFCCTSCFDNNLMLKKECSSCITKSICTINQFQYYLIEQNEFVFVKRWIISCDFFPNFNFNLNNKSYKTLREDWDGCEEDDEDDDYENSDDDDEVWEDEDEDDDDNDED